MYFSIKSTKYTKIREKYEKNVTLRYLLIVVVIKYSLLNPRWPKPEVEVVQNRQFISTYSVSILLVPVEFPVRSVGIGRSVRPLVTTLNSGKAADTIELSFGVVDWIGPRNRVLNGGIATL